MTRLKRRKRAEEAGVSLEYLQQLHQKHEDWLKLPKLWTPPPFPASDYTCQGQSLPDVLGKLRQNVDLHAVQEPPAIQGKVRDSLFTPWLPLLRLAVTASACIAV